MQHAYRVHEKPGQPADATVMIPIFSCTTRPLACRLALTTKHRELHHVHVQIHEDRQTCRPHSLSPAERGRTVPNRKSASSALPTSDLTALSPRLLSLEITDPFKQLVWDLGSSFDLFCSHQHCIPVLLHTTVSPGFPDSPSPLRPRCNSPCPVCQS